MDQGGKEQSANIKRLSAGHRNLITAISIITILFVLAVSQSVFSLLDVSSEPSVWFAEHKQVHRINGVTGSVNKSIPIPHEATDIAIDQTDYSVWVLMHQHLIKISSDTNIVVEKSLKDEINTSSPGQMEIDPYRGNIWIASGKTVLALDRNAKLINQISLEKPVADLVINPDGGINVLSDGMLHTYTVSGNAVSVINSNDYIDKPGHLEIDWINNIQWLANKKKIVAITTGSGGFSRKEYTVTDAAGIKDIQQDILTGRLWVITNSYVRAYNSRKTDPVVEFKIPERFASSEQLAVGSVGKSLWVGTKKDVVQFNENGAILTETKIQNEFEALTATSYAPVPQIQFINPPALTNNSKPNVDLLLGASCGLHECELPQSWYQSLGIDSTLNGRQIGREYVINGNIARYVPPVRLPEGENNATAIVTDIYGNSSSFVPHSFIVDTIPPKFIKFDPANGAKVPYPDLVIEGSVDDATAVIALENMAGIGGEVVRSNPLDFAFKVPLTVGINTFVFSAIDPAGNRSETTFTITRTAAIELTISSPKDQDVISGNRVDVTGTVSGIAGITVKVNDTDAVIQPDSTYIANDVPLVAGLNILEVTATTPWGGIATRSIKVYAGSGGWGEPVLIGNGGADFPEARFMGCGNAMTVWTHTDSNGEGKIWGSHYIAGGAWSQSYIINDKKVLNQTGPQIDTTDQGELALTFAAHTGNTTEIPVLRYTLDQGWSEMLAPRDNLPALTPNVAATSQSGIQSIWTRRVQYYNYSYDVYSSQYNSNFASPYDPNLWSPIQKIEGYRSDRLDELYPNIAKNENGDAVAVWMRRAWWEWGYDVVASIYKNGTWSDHEVISTGTLEAHPRTAIDADGNIMVVWQQRTGACFFCGTDKVMARRYIAGAGWEPELLLSNPEEMSGEPVISGNDKGEVTVAWVEGAGGGVGSEPYWGIYGHRSPMLYAAKFDPQTGWGQSVLVDKVEQEYGPGKGNYYIVGPSVAFNNKGKAVLVWYELGGKYSDDGLKFIPSYLMKASRHDGTAWEVPYSIGPGKYGNIYKSSVDIDDCDNIVAGWQYWDYDPDTRQYNKQVWVNSYSTKIEGSKPVVIAPPSITKEATAVLTPVVLGQASATDPFDGVLVATPNKTGPFPVGSTVITWTATNSKGVTAKDLQVVTITDTTPPELVIPDNIRLEVSDPDAIPIAIDLGEATATDIFQPVDISRTYSNKFDIGTHKIKWTAKDPNGNTTEAIQTVEVVFTGDIFLRIETPEHGDYIDASHVQVSGRWLGPVNTGITVNGAIAEVYNGRFYANNVPVTEGENEIVATATTISGAQYTHAVSFTVTTVTENIILSPQPVSGIAPLTVKFDVVSRTESPISRISIQFGDAHNSSDSTVFAAERLTHTYTEHGIYTAKAVIETMDGYVHNRSVYIVIHDPAEQDKMFKSVWDGMNNALIAGQAEEAKNYLSSGVRDKYGPVFEALLPHMSDIVASYSLLYRGKIDNVVAEYVILRPYQDKQQVYMIYFLRNYDGVWRVDGM